GGLFKFVLINTNGAGFVGTLGTAVAGAWQHLAVVYNGSAAIPSSSVVGFVNGAATGAGAASGAILYGTQVVTLGSNSNLSIRENLSGMMDEIRVWTTALSGS